MPGATDHEPSGREQPAEERSSDLAPDARSERGPGSPVLVELARRLGEARTDPGACLASIESVERALGDAAANEQLLEPEIEPDAAVDLLELLAAPAPEARLASDGSARPRRAAREGEAR